VPSKKWSQYRNVPGVKLSEVLVRDYKVSIQERGYAFKKAMNYTKRITGQQKQGDAKLTPPFLYSTKFWVIV